MLGPVSTGMGDQFPARDILVSNQPKGSDALQLGSKGKYGSCVGGR